jgi:hypothetical protein
MSYANSTDGPWSNPQLLFEEYDGGDTNIAPIILPNGSVTGLWRRWTGTSHGSRIHVLTATDWMEPTSYVLHYNDSTASGIAGVFTEMGQMGTEV